MLTEEQLIIKITDKLIEIAKHPEKRKEFIVAAGNDYFYCYRNDPMMCDVDKYILATYYALQIKKAKKHDDLLDLYKKSVEHINEMTDSIDANNAMTFLSNIVSLYYQKKKDLSAEIEFLIDSFNFSINTQEGVTIDNIKSLISLTKKDENYAPLYELLSSIDCYFTDFENSFQNEDNPEQAWPEYAQKAISDINEKVYAAFDEDKVEEQEKGDMKEDEDDNIIDPDSFAKAILQAYQIIVPPKRKSPRKGDFDYYYNKAEKGDPEAQRIIAACYREGNTVTKNERLANFWQAVADEHRFIE